MNGRLDTDEDSHSQGDADHGKKGSSLVVTEMTERDGFEEMGQDHKIKCQMSKPKYQRKPNNPMSNLKNPGHPVRTKQPRRGFAGREYPFDCAFNPALSHSDGMHENSLVLVF